MPITAPDDLVQLQRELEERLTRFAETDLHAALGDLASGAVYDSARRYVTRPSKRLFGMAFLVAYHALTCGTPRHGRTDLIAVAAALEVRHTAVLLHDDIVDGDTVRGGQPTAHHALNEHFAREADHAALFVGDALTALLAQSILDSHLPAPERVRLTALLLQLTAEVAAGRSGSYNSTP